ncbi:Nif3-like dinuclear metal center hexameric protein [Pseudalkalibacillus caeni]|uniref:GTP cyclohydrolase 1 type 2 homolog n=1 Tax=Exobacillus caeni TaxID=2574798 RepID=A0A5R9F8Z2_9BACL|nr:Nif3-like dinuclear metal center hexameric protein [Pseudalkalibacillus caeni]TLS36175.1 Nif3-like dinuclear metal center hexameric protein [Pseudalkalibacillus caeni]
MNLKQFEQYIQKLFTEELLEEFHDDYGFTDKSNDSISKIGYSTNLSIETIEKAAENNVDLMVTHHDAWDFIYGLKEECLNKLEEYNISHFWIHGPLDFVDFGTSTSLMKVMGIDRVIKYSAYDNGEMPGVGEFSKPIDFNVVVQRLRNKLEEPVRFWKNNEKQVKKVGVLTGAGHSSTNIKMAVDEGCDTYVTGEATLYTIQYAKFAGINLLVGSHTFTEIFGVESLVNKIQGLDTGIKIIELKEKHFELNH